MRLIPPLATAVCVLVAGCGSSADVGPAANRDTTPDPTVTIDGSSAAVVLEASLDVIRAGVSADAPVSALVAGFNDAGFDLGTYVVGPFP